MQRHHRNRPRPAGLSRAVLLCALVPTGIVLAASLYLFHDYWHGVPEDAVASYVGRATCIECHQQQGDDWHGSHHDRAMDLATAETVLGDFNDQEFTYAGIPSKMYRRDDKFYITTDNAAGELQEFEIKYVFGFTPLQQYMVEMPDDVERAEGEIGRVQVLPLCWDTKKKEWFHIYQSQNPPVVAGGPLHWTGVAQNWNLMCADCHSTNLQKNFSLDELTYRTTYSEIDVSCEACHGPGSIHVDLANSKSPFWDRKLGYGLTVNLKSEFDPVIKSNKLDPTMQLETCARCHSRRHIVHPNYRPGNRYADHYGLTLLNEGVYHADGQILDEVYVYGSFLQSRMFHEKVACTDCHDPHTAGRRISETTGKPLAGNSLCTRCHTPAKYDSAVHHRHEEKEGLTRDGTRCVDCHMPERTYMVVDPRRDHSLRVPRPDLTVKLGTPNACNTCHDKKDETPEWAAAKVVEWFGPKRAGNESFAETLTLGRLGKPEAEAMLIELVKKRQAPAIARATAVSLLRNYPASSQSLSALEGALDDDSPLIRAAAVNSLGQLAETLPPAWSTEFLDDFLSPRLNDPLREVRTGAARALAGLPPSTFSAKETKSLKQALKEYFAAQDAIAERYTAHMNRGTLYERLAQGRRADRDMKGARDLLNRAIKAYETAILVEPNMVGPRSNLAPHYDRLGRTDDAIKIRQKESQLLARDIGFLPKDATLRYRHGMMQYVLGKMDEAEQSLVKACELAPDDQHFLMSLALFFHKLARWDDALQRAEQLLKMQPRNPTYRQIHDRIRKRLPSD